jgi:hypothetical protein
MRISFNPLAERELNEATQSYAVENPDLSAAFLAEVERACLLRQNTLSQGLSSVPRSVDVS